MSRFLIISNRLPVQISISENDIGVEPSVGGLATGMMSVSKSFNSLWIGWSGVDFNELTNSQVKKVNSALKKEKCVSVNLTQEEVELYYEGFSNKTIWPLFHYFNQFVEYEDEQWQAYKRVNQKFADVIAENMEGVDKIWIHDYHLLLLPQMIKEKFPDVTIGFFLHIPFPSYELFRILPWRNEIIQGMLGADLLGFHTFDYERHFMSAVRRLLGYDININEIHLPKRIVKVDNFPMGIDYDKFQDAALDSQKRSVRDKSEIRKELERYYLLYPETKFVLSIDRLDYTKGLINRLEAFEYFLENYPEYRNKITLVLLAVPSRIGVDQYQQMKSEVDEIVGRINGTYSSINRNPIWYFYRSLPFENLVDLYNYCEIALITPIRDGMNLVAKEFIASKTDGRGVLILSEMAGASKEMSEALIINPNDRAQIAEAIKRAIEMPLDEQIERNTVLQKRLKRYNIEKWATDFLNSLDKVLQNEQQYLAKKLTNSTRNKIIKELCQSDNRIFFLDYDGTLTGFKDNPKHARPDKELYELLDNLANNPKNRVVLISGRDKNTFEEWFGDKPYTLIVEHGVWYREAGGQWEMIEPLDDSWKESIRSSLEFYVDRTPGSFIEEKNYSLVWHYRKSDPELGLNRAIELKDEMTSLVSNLNLEIMEGNKVLEIKNRGINKGRAALKVLHSRPADKIMAIGDDWTDEFLFSDLPNEAITIKVGMAHTVAGYKVENFEEVRGLLQQMACEE
ncbi:bifunctional alpha,alpha-trehalose-phosphate synthase (UDP-forming)/trehalose-phosphatase [Mariniphaga sediminis]|jgi:trehalose 6-phosphate synthase/phosphatase|uniref:Bifunctional alpha,alpha-trehalose-phosphate synthase (UDP-forming)/trehalose-phosphatase n=2 Tax=Mariniphaga sediminis TaxID=1628158 RepID=A0A399CYG3_9BACT|nr:bifunctional alpha,alpha-trehalose-phosphate synthase (UDP-forming)/trehalose-phosphatase [Mariniphaga sediminis]RIH64367.1 bifunctional alpha,alpha-trehalose-phosphate synthase (UDP-forming)/trehalose-phosphatase [Mariniphaga sediminis]